MSRYKSNICRGDPDALGLNEIERHFCEESHRTHHSVGRDSLIRRHGWGHFRVQAIDGIRGADIPPQDIAPILTALEWEWQERLKVRIQTRRATNPYGFFRAARFGQRQA